MTLRKPTQSASIQTITLRSKTAGLFLDSSKGLFHIFLGGHSASEGKLSAPRQAQPPWRRCRRLEVSQCTHQTKLLLCPSAGRLPEPPAPEASLRLHHFSPPGRTTHHCFVTSPLLTLQSDYKGTQNTNRKENKEIHGREHTALPHLRLHKVQSCILDLYRGSLFLAGTLLFLGFTELITSLTQLN